MITTILTDEHIQRIGLEMPSKPVMGSLIVFARAIEQAVLQSPDVQAWKRDAERMKWYFGSADKSPWMPEYMRGCNDGWSVDQWRMSIDAAMQEQKTC